jgi:hypothetical protein
MWATTTGSTATAPLCFDDIASPAAAPATKREARGAPAKHHQPGQDGHQAEQRGEDVGSDEASVGDLGDLSERESATAPYEVEPVACFRRIVAVAARREYMW